jgi:hypothetical protein
MLAKVSNTLKKSVSKENVIIVILVIVNLYVYFKYNGEIEKIKEEMNRIIEYV